MTLIAAWITPEFRIVASDSKITGTDGYLGKGSPQKVFVSEKIAVGLFGEFGFRMIQFKKKMITNKIKLHNWDCNKLLCEITETLENEYLDRYKSYFDFHDEYESNILVIPKDNEPKIYRIQFNRIQKEYYLNEYKDIHQITELGDLFFSEQILNNGEIDFEHQWNLLANFTNILDLPDVELNINVKLPIQVKQLIKLVANAMDDQNKELNRNNIGGNKVYYAYSINRYNWQSNSLELHNMKN